MSNTAVQGCLVFAVTFPFDGAESAAQKFQKHIVVTRSSVNRQSERWHGRNWWGAVLPAELAQSVLDDRFEARGTPVFDCFNPGLKFGETISVIQDKCRNLSHAVASLSVDKVIVDHRSGVLHNTGEGY